MRVYHTSVREYDSRSVLFFQVSRGSFEANPPFVPGLMTAAVARAESLLTRADGALSFAFVVPGWQDDPSFQALHASRYSRQFSDMVINSDFARVYAYVRVWQFLPW